MQGIAHWMDKRASITPNRVALIGEERRLSYAEMAGEINQLARILVDEYQIETGDRVAILSMNRIEYFIILFAIAKIGAIAVPLNIRLSAKELEFQLQDSSSIMLIVSKEFYSLGVEIRERCAIPHLVPIDEQEDEESVFTQMQSYSTNLFEVNHVEGSNRYLIVYTSGTTGRPKGAVLTQENMFWNAINSNTAIDITSKDKILTVLPLFHIGGIGLFAFPGLLVGATIIVPNRFLPEQCLDLIEQEQITIMMGVPTIFDALRKSSDFTRANLSSVRWFYSGGAPCPHELIQYYQGRGLPFGQGFGMTETSPTIFMLSEEDCTTKIGSIGKPVMFCEVQIVNEEGKPLPRGEIGEMWLKGANLFKEYWKLPEETKKSFSGEWFHTGDLAKQDEDGFYYIAGRKKEMIISGGENIYPLEVEQVLYRHLMVDEVAVIGIPDEKWGEIPIAVVALKSGAQVLEQELIEYCQSHLAKYKCPKKIDFLPTLPKNATGKIDKPSIKKAYIN